jgi:hypothetical protein
MSAGSMPLAEITAKAIRVLCREIGAVNTARFLNQFTTGSGNYTEERDRILGEPTVDELVATIEQRREKKNKSEKPARKRSRRST